MPKVIRLKESDLNRIVKRVIKEGADGPEDAFISCLTKAGIKGVVSGNLPPACAAAAVNPKDEVAIGKCVDALTKLKSGDWVALAKLGTAAVGCIAGKVTNGGSGGSRIPTDMGSW